MLTEDEAKTKACFRAATFGGSQQLANGPGPNCIGSACMAFRWAGSVKRRFITAHNHLWDDKAEPARPENVPASYEWVAADCDEPAGWLEPEADAVLRRSGFCGLAGRPE